MTGKDKKAYDRSYLQSLGGKVCGLLLHCPAGGLADK